MTEHNAHTDKYNDPRVKITRRGILIGLGVVAFSVIGTWWSITARKTKLEQTTEFWGKDAIVALQLAEEIELLPKPSEEPENGVRISGLPGLGHLRHVLLDDRSYDWNSGQTGGLPMTDTVMVLRLTDPTAKRFPVQQIAIDIESGRVGHRDGGETIRLNDRYQNAMPNFLKQIADFEPLRVENKKQDG